MPTVHDFKNKLERLMLRENVDITLAWFMGLIEPHQPEEAPRVITVGGERVWSWPYEVRVISLLKKYLKADHSFQETITAARADNIYWRGDDREQFNMIINETERMRSMGVVAYRKEVKEKMRNFKMGKPVSQDDEAKAERRAIQSESNDYLQDLSENRYGKS